MLQMEKTTTANLNPNIKYVEAEAVVNKEGSAKNIYK